jgi:2-iminobutanoate/2-iminopropanoate deaminase
MIENVHSDQVASLPLPLPHGTRAGDYVFISGQVAVRPDGGTVIGDFDTEVRVVLGDVCKVTAFLLNATLFDPFNEIYREYFADPLPARSTVVAPLSNPDLRIEVEAIAYIPRTA